MEDFSGQGLQRCRGIGSLTYHDLQNVYSMPNSSVKLLPENTEEFSAPFHNVKKQFNLQNDTDHVFDLRNNYTTSYIDPESSNSHTYTVDTHSKEIYNGHDAILITKLPGKIAKLINRSIEYSIHTMDTLLTEADCNSDESILSKKMSSCTTKSVYKSFDYYVNMETVSTETIFNFEDTTATVSSSKQRYNTKLVNESLYHCITTSDTLSIETNCNYFYGLDIESLNKNYFVPTVDTLSTEKLNDASAKQDFGAQKIDQSGFKWIHQNFKDILNMDNNWEKVSRIIAILLSFAKCYSSQDVSISVANKQQDNVEMDELSDFQNLLFICNKLESSFSSALMNENCINEQKLRNERSILDTSISKLTNEIQVLNLKVDNSSANHVNFEKSIKLQEDELENANISIRSLKSEIDKLTEENDTLNYNCEVYEKTIAQLQKNLILYKTSKNKIKSHLKNQISDLNNFFQEKLENKVKTELELNRQLREALEKNNELERIQKIIKQYHDEEICLKSNLIDKLQSELQENRQHLLNKTSEFETLKQQNFKLDEMNKSLTNENNRFIDLEKTIESACNRGNMNSTLDNSDGYQTGASMDKLDFEKLKFCLDDHYFSYDSESVQNYISHIKYLENIILEKNRLNTSLACELQSCQDEIEWFEAQLLTYKERCEDATFYNCNDNYTRRSTIIQDIIHRSQIQMLQELTK